MADVAHVGHRRDDGHVELALEALLHDFHVEHAQETTTEPESQGGRALRLEDEGRVIELELFHAVTEFLIVLGVDRVDARKDHGFDILETLHGLFARRRGEGQGVADLDLLSVFNARDDVAHVAGAHRVLRLQVEAEHAYFVGIVLAAGVEEAHAVSFLISPFSTR